VRKEERAFATYAPALWEEIGGLAEGLAIPMERAVLWFGNSGLRPPMGACSAVMSAGVYGRNLDQCAATAEAVALLRALPHAMQYNDALLDAGGVAAVVEAVPGSVAVRTRAWLACTNHFQSPLLRPLNRRAAHSQLGVAVLDGQLGGMSKPFEWPVPRARKKKA